MPAGLFHYKFFDYPNIFELVFNKEKYTIEQENKIRHNINIYLKNTTTLSKENELNRIILESRNKSESLIREIDSSINISLSNNMISIIVLIITFYLGSIIGAINSFYSGNIQGIISMSKSIDTAKKMLDISKDYITNNLINVISYCAIGLIVTTIVIFSIGYIPTAYNRDL